MARKQIGSNAVFLGGSKSSVIIGDHIYAYSGSVGVSNSTVTLLEFQSEANLVKGSLQFFYAEPANDKFLYTVAFNGVTIIQYQVFGPNDTNGEHLLSLPIFLIIPPNTLVECKAINQEQAVVVQQTASFTGRVYA